jgi:hypothetical protein
MLEARNLHGRLKSYEGLDAEYLHQFVDHAVAYVKGHVHTNAWRTFGAFPNEASKEPMFPLGRSLVPVLDERAFRYNERKDEDGDSGRFRHVVRNCAARQLTYKTLIGKTDGS